MDLKGLRLRRAAALIQTCPGLTSDVVGNKVALEEPVLHIVFDEILLNNVRLGMTASTSSSGTPARELVVTC